VARKHALDFFAPQLAVGIELGVKLVRPGLSMDYGVKSSLAQLLVMANIRFGCYIRCEHSLTWISSQKERLVPRTDHRWSKIQVCSIVPRSEGTSVSSSLSRHNYRYPRRCAATCNGHSLFGRLQHHDNIQFLSQSSTLQALGKITTVFQDLPPNVG